MLFQFDEALSSLISLLRKTLHASLPVTTHSMTDPQLRTALAILKIVIALLAGTLVGSLVRQLL
jgi:hypothetical protein